MNGPRKGGLAGLQTSGDNRPMLTMGQVLREARGRRNVSLEEVEDQTHIRKKYLTALEADDYAALPEPVYTRGFLEIYADFLGLDPTFASKLYQPPIRAPLQKLRPVSAFSEGPSIPLRAVVVFILACLGIVAVSYLYMQYLEFASNTNEVVVTRPTVVATPTSYAMAVVPTATPTPLPTPSPTPVRAVEVTVQITERSWLRVIADGQNPPLFEGELQAGDTRTWRAKDRLEMRVGNAGGVDVTVNGLRQGKLGASGEVKNVTWGRQ